MKGSIGDIEAQRARWRRYRQIEGMSIEASDGFASGGLGRHVDDLGMRLVFLPADPEADHIPLDAETLGWLKAQRATPYGGQPPVWGHRHTATASALLIFDQHQEDKGWNKVLAVHRHGGMELAIGNLAYTVHGTRVFPLRRMVALAWAVTAMQVELVERWSLRPPFELTVAVRNALGGTLGMFAEGWAEVGAGLWDFATCIEDRVVLRQEFDDGLDPQGIALGLGDRLENVFGTTHRRHLANRGEYDGRFDPRFAC